MNYEQALIEAKNGNAIIFFGAGFSYGLSSDIGLILPTGKELSAILCKEIGISITEDLRISSRHFIKRKGETELIKLLKNYFIINEIDEYYNHITSVPWRSAYTTNYDLAFEVSAKKNNIEYISVDMESNPRSSAGKNRVIHINGHIENVDSENLQTSFKLTNESYLTEQFRNSSWSTTFIRDITSAHAVFFVGYSLYDIDIQEILFSDEAVFQKTFFIERVDLTNDDLNNSILSDFGTIKNIGISQFSKDLFDVDPLALNDPNEIIITSFEKFSLQDTNHSTQDTDVINLFYKGELNQELLINDILSKKNNYIIYRDELAIALESLKEKENLVIYSGLANGKTIFSKQIAANMLGLGYSVFELKDEYLTQYAYKEIELILKNFPKIIFIIESYTEHLDVVEHINANRHSETKLILTSRTHEHERSESDVYYSRKIINISTTLEIPIDKLTRNDINKIYDFFELYGLWGQKAQLPKFENIKFITQKANSEYHGILLGLFESSHIVQKLEILLKEISQSKTLMNHIVAILCLSITNISKPSFHMVSALTNSSAIFEPSLRKNTIFQQLIHSHNSALFVKSSVLAEFLLTRFPNSQLLVQAIIEIAKNAKNKSNGSEIFSKFYRDLASFRYIAKILPNKGQRESLILFYQGLRDIPQERDNPHFWLQYAMARLSHPDSDNLVNAKLHLETALAKAKLRKNFWTDDIETQFAKYHLLNAIYSIPLEMPSKAIIELNASVSLIIGIHRKNRQKKAIYKPIKLIGIFFDRFDEHFNSEQLNLIQNHCNDLLKIFTIDEAKFGDYIEFKIAKKTIDRVLQQSKLINHAIANQ